MRSTGRTLDRDLARDIALVCLADALVGVSFGAIAVGLGLPLWLPVLLSVVVFAGASQFIFIGIVGAGGNPVAAVVAGLLVNARHVPFGFTVGDVFGRGWLRRLVGSHLMVDETVAFTLAQDEPRRRRIAYWTCGLGLFAAWNLGVLAGAFGGRAIGDTDAFGLDAAFPAVLLALLLPSLTDAAIRRAAAVGVVVALAATPFLPAGLPVLLALAGVAASLPRRSPAAATDPGSPPSPEAPERLPTDRTTP
ncbi:4-azaleucine resistance probable transporter AzlC [Streptomyces sp. DvalAA-14]|uniref:AzlC family ABC transporter permease n=1 Tax=unclassified Streptomyces TaxID=2593676 RepID=UPI00081AF8B3|nr:MULTISPECIES: AzlC family ABC transporter permease [unclassified Streptomyces]MYS19772.1 branched-chain amino acid ABC transporter permease [Streptomyces sp. SID4948]SCD52832.1 4-azaleucine resistance probable transporter AzlC [Streptomyces sp. DvalAA-14]